MIVWVLITPHRGGSVVGRSVLVKSDGTLSINSFKSGSSGGGQSWVRLYE
jgi:hypothetical protein